MRFIHTADWHLGRLFHGTHLTEDQHHVLMQLVEVARSEKVDAVLVAGDVYDRAVPPPEAVELLDEVLSRLVMDLGVAVVMIAGNHDSPDRLNFASRLLAGRRLHIRGRLNPVGPVTLADAHGPVDVFAIPYAEPSVVREELGCESICDHNSAMRELTTRIAAQRPRGRRGILLGHAFVVGGQECESERPLSVGGASAVEAACFDGFDYVAMGHLHRRQKIGGDAIRYSGSPLKYSFDEADHAKSVELVEMDEHGRCSVRPVALSARRDVRRISGTMAELLAAPAGAGSRADYLEVTLLDEGPVLDAIGRLREVYPNVMSLVRPAYVPGGTEQARVNLRGMDETSLFRSFVGHVTGGQLSAEQAAAFAATVDAVRAAEREVGP